MIILLQVKLVVLELEYLVTKTKIKMTKINQKVVILSHQKLIKTKVCRKVQLNLNHLCLEDKVQPQILFKLKLQTNQDHKIHSKDNKVIMQAKYQILSNLKQIIIPHKNR